ncbi:MAG TPA: Uma2 family endonuclease [Archangium sp.]
MTERGKKHTIAEWLALPPERRVELIDGAFIEKAAPDFPHGSAQTGVLLTLGAPFQRGQGGGGSGFGGWWFATEVDVRLGDNGFRPDIAGWRRERMPERTSERPVTLRPDWICEVTSETNRTNDTIRKLRRYHEAGVPHYWVLDPAEFTLTVFRHEARGYLSVLFADRDQLVRAEPFEALEFEVVLLFGDDPS